MPIYTPDDREFDDFEERYRWFPAVAAIEYGEEDAPAEIPAELSWLDLAPASRRYDFDDVECSLAYQSDAGYRCTVWDCSGEDDVPWAVFLVDDFGVRLLGEYSIFVEEMDEEERDAVLGRAAEELPDRLVAGEFDRSGTPCAVPDWLME